MKRRRCISSVKTGEAVYLKQFKKGMHLNLTKNNAKQTFKIKKAIESPYFNTLTDNICTTNSMKKDSLKYTGSVTPAGGKSSVMRSKNNTPDLNSNMKKSAKTAESSIINNTFHNEQRDVLDYKPSQVTAGDNKLFQKLVN